MIHRAAKCHFSPWLLSLLLAAGCALSPLGTAGFNGPVRVVGKPRIVSGNAAYRLMQEPASHTMTPYIADDVATIDVIIWKTDGLGDLDADETATALLGSVYGAEAPIIIENLKKEQKYRVRLVAYLGRENTHPENRGDPLGARLDDESTSCITEFDTGLQDFLGSMSFNLKLKNQTFEGERQGVASITPGIIVDTTANEILGTATPAP
ncbi:MAG: hypothetical protein VKN33_08665 [Candidatus Sericytochromatia bacterium]|nr:hypothetical protein [Candidatus Sericytochromatia bacterium]